MRYCKIDNTIGKTVTTWDGQLLDEKETIESQVATDTLLKLVFMKQYELDNSEREMAMTFYQGHAPSEIDVCMPQYGTHLVVRLVWGGGERSTPYLGSCTCTYTLQHIVIFSPMEEILAK